MREWLSYIYEINRYKSGEELVNNFNSIDYNSMYESNLKENELFRRQIQSSHPNSVLEIGTGFGNRLINLASEFHDIHFIGIDQSDLRIKKCKHNSYKLKNIEFIHANFSQLNSLNQKFDLALIDSVLMYLSHDELLEGLTYLYNNVKKIFIIDFSSKYAKIDSKTRDGYLHNLNKILNLYPKFRFDTFPMNKTKLLSERSGRWNKFGVIITIDNLNLNQSI